MLRGIGETPIMPLGISYLDDYSKEENAPFYLGLFVYWRSLFFFFGQKRWILLVKCIAPFLSLNSLHPHRGSLRSYVWIYARVLPLQDLCGCWICGFRYGLIRIVQLSRLKKQTKQLWSHTFLSRRLKNQISLQNCVDLILSHYNMLNLAI